MRIGATKFLTMHQNAPQSKTACWYRRFINPTKVRFVDFSEVIINRFWRKVDIRSKAECWNWKGTKDDAGYGIVNLPKKDYGRRFIRATWVSLILSGRQRPDGLFALHSCDNKSCVNPHHLRWGTRKENNADAMQRNHAYAEHCRHKLGHCRDKLSVEQKAEVLELHQAGVPNVRIAEKMGVTRQAISYIVLTSKEAA